MRPVATDVAWFVCLSVVTKESKVSPGRRSPGRRSFHSRGPPAEKLLSPCLLCVRGTSVFRLPAMAFRQICLRCCRGEVVSK